MNIKWDMTGLGRWTTWNCVRNWNLTILPNGIRTNKNLSKRIQNKKLSWILRCKQIISYRRDDQTEWWFTKIKGTCQIVDYPILADHWMKIKENKKRVKYLNLARELKKLWNLKVMVLPIVIGALTTVPKDLVRGLEDLVSWLVVWVLWHINLCRLFNT